MTKLELANLLREMRFEEVGTGGNCTALQYERPDGRYLLVADECEVPAMAESGTVEMGIYGPDDDGIDARWERTYNTATDSEAMLTYILRFLSEIIP